MYANLSLYRKGNKYYQCMSAFCSISRSYVQLFKEKNMRLNLVRNLPVAALMQWAGLAMARWTAGDFQVSYLISFHPFSVGWDVSV